MKLLIVEDEARMADLLRKGLTEEGHIATCASDGAEGLAIAYLAALYNFLKYAKAKNMSPRR